MTQPIVSGGETVQFSLQTLKLTDLAGRSIRLVKESDNSITVKADSLIYKMFHPGGHYASREEIKNILTTIKIPENDQKYQKTAKLLLKQFMPQTAAEKEAFAKCFKELYKNESPFNALDYSLFGASDPSRSQIDLDFYDLLSKAGALGGDGQKLKNYIRECLLSGNTQSQLILNFFTGEENTVGKTLVDNIAEEAFQKLKKQAAGLPKSRLFEFTDQEEKLGYIPSREKFDRLRERGWIPTQKSLDKEKFDDFLKDCKEGIIENDLWLNLYRSNPNKNSLKTEWIKIIDMNTALRDLLYPDQKFSDLEQKLCTEAALPELDVNILLEDIKNKKNNIIITGKFIGALLDKVQDAGNKKKLQEGIEDIHASRNRKYQSLAHDVAKAVNKTLPDQGVVRNTFLRQQVDKMDKVGEDKYSLLRLALEEIPDKGRKELLAAAAKGVWGEQKPRIY